MNALIDVPSSGAGATQGPRQNTRKEKKPGVSLRETEREIEIPLQITSDPTNPSASGKVNAPIGVPSSAAGTTQGPGQNTRKEKEPGVSLRETEREIRIPLEITSDPTNASTSGKVKAPIGVPSSAAGTTQGPGQNTRKEKEPGVSLHETEREIQIPLEITSDPTNVSTSGKVKALIGVPSSAAGTTQGPGQNTRKENEPGVSSREASPPERDEGRICNDDFFLSSFESVSYVELWLPLYK